MPKLVQVRLYSGAQYALCGGQHSNAPDTKQRSFLCDFVGWQAGGLFCVTWHFLVGKVLNGSSFCTPCFAHASPAFWVRSHSWGTSFPHFVHSIQCHALSKEGPTSWVDAAYWICSFATWLKFPSNIPTQRKMRHFVGGCR